MPEECPAWLLAIIFIVLVGLIVIVHRALLEPGSQEGK